MKKAVHFLRTNVPGITVLLAGQLLTIWLLSLFVPDLKVDSFSTAVVILVAYMLAQVLFWWAFVEFFARLPYFLYPLLTFVLNGVFVTVVAGAALDVHFSWPGTGILIITALSVSYTISASFLRVSEDVFFDRIIIRFVMRRYADLKEAHTPGLIFLEIDGLGEEVLRQALDRGCMPALQRWITAGTHCITGWETDYSSQTGAMQAGILLGNNENIPAYRWWDRRKGRVVLSGNPWDAKEIEARVKNGKNLLTGKGASRGNLFTGGAEDSLFTISTLLDRQPASTGLYMFLFNPVIMARVITRFLLEMIEERLDSLRQWWRKAKYALRIRYSHYAVYRGFMGAVLQDLVTYVVIGDVLRGVPDVYAAYGGYDDLSHFAGPHSPESFRMLRKIDRHIARIERALAKAPRPYQIVVLSDHGQSEGLTFDARYGVSLPDLVKGLIRGDRRICALLETEETWDRINALLSDTANMESRTARVLRTMLASKTRDGIVAVGHSRNAAALERDAASAREAHMIVLASGCMGLIYANDSKQRLTYEEIQALYPDLIPGLVSHPGIGFVLVKSAEDGSLVIGKDGFHFLEDDRVDGTDPLAVYGPHAARHLYRESQFPDCPDIVVNTTYDPLTEEICTFEYQVGHHGGLGGPQSHAFLLHPIGFAVGNEPVVGAEEVNRLLRRWRDGLD